MGKSKIKNMTISPTEFGKIRSQQTTKPKDVSYSVKFLDSTYLEEVKELQEIIARNLPDKEIFRSTTAQEFQEILNQKKSVIGVHAGDCLVAYNMVSIPGWMKKTLEQT